MLNSFFTYLIEASFCLIVLALAYRLFFCQLTHFTWNRWYLIGSLFLSLLIPFFPPLSLLFSSGTFSQDIPILNFTGIEFTLPREQISSSLAEVQPETNNLYSMVSLLFLGLYLMGCIYKTVQFVRNLKEVITFIRKSPKVKEEGYHVIRVPKNAPAFSFLHFIFLPEESSKLSKEDVRQILQHEQVHVAQRHSLDLLLFELAGVFFWFHPMIYYLKASIRKVHEFLVDSEITRQHRNASKYGELLIKLATQQGSGPLMNTFSNKQIMQRIKMLTQPKSSPMEKLKFLLTLPVLAVALVLCSFFQGDPNPKKAIAPIQSSFEANLPAQEIVIRKISWLGNSAFSDKALNKALGLQKGDIYTAEELNSRLSYNPNGPDLSALYMNNGYLFFSVSPKEVFVDHAVDLTFTISEGPQAKIGKIVIKGNKKVPTEEVLEEVNIEKGELFNRSKLIKAQSAIAQMGAFNPETIQINPIPYQNPEEEGGGWIVDLEFIVEEK